MSLMEPIATAGVVDDRWAAAASAADRFRGAFIRHHARGEMLISEVLLALHDTKQGPSVSLPHLGGQRLLELRTAVEARNAQCGHMKYVLATLDDFQRFDQHRSFICHGTATLLMDQRQQWALGYQLLCFKAKAPVRSTLYLSKVDAAATLTDLERTVDRLPGALGHVRKSAAPGSST